MERRSFLKAGGLLGLAATPAVLAAADPPPPRSDNLRLDLPTPEEAVLRWYTQDVEIAHTFDLQVAFVQMAEAVMRRLPTRLELPEPDVRRRLHADPGARVRRVTSPRFVLDIYDNGVRGLPAGGPMAVPLMTVPASVYAGGHSVPSRILACARRGVADLVAEMLRESDRAAFTCPRAVIDFKGYMLEFFFYSQRVYRVPPPAEPTTGPVTRTTIYPERP